ncbi:hypothetical protein HC024_00155 [Methylococcaceae bacterium WWC4]|nr:hypothetical protein [Methylococcaceae bacterium WWC4]
MSLSYRKRYVLAALESSYGVDATPTQTIMCGDITIKPLVGESVERKRVQAAFGGTGKIRIKNYVTLSFTTEFTGAGTAGTAPPWAILAKACGFTETLTAAAITGTAQVGGSTTSIKLAAGASAVDDFYVGMPIAITAGTGNGQKGRIIDYNGTSKVATIAVPWAVAPIADSTYSIGANALYIPHSNASGSNTSASLYFGVDGVRHILLGARGNMKINQSSGALETITWEFTGLLGVISDQSNPVADYSAWQIPVTTSTENTGDINLLGYANPVLSEFSVDIGNVVTYRNPVNSEAVLITDRKVMGNFRIEATTVATKDWWTFAKNAQYGPICLRHGTTAGNVVGVVGPNVQLQDPDYADSDNIAELVGSLEYVPVVGNDEIRIFVN